MRIKAVVVLAIVLIMGVVAFFALKPGTANTRDNAPKEHASETISTEAGAEKNAAIPVAKTTTSEEREFNYQPDEPENGQLRGVVEVGARGFNSFVVNLDNQNRWKMVS